MVCSTAFRVSHDRLAVGKGDDCDQQDDCDTNGEHGAVADEAGQHEDA